MKKGFKIAVTVLMGLYLAYEMYTLVLQTVTGVQYVQQYWAHLKEMAPAFISYGINLLLCILMTVAAAVMLIAVWKDDDEIRAASYICVFTMGLVTLIRAALYLGRSAEAGADVGSVGSVVISFGQDLLMMAIPFLYLLTLKKPSVFLIIVIAVLTAGALFLSFITSSGLYMIVMTMAVSGVRHAAYFVDLIGRRVRWKEDKALEPLLEMPEDWDFLPETADEPTAQEG